MMKMIRDEVLTAEEVEGINNKNRYNINPVINKDSELLSKHILELQADKGRLTDKLKKLEQQIEQMKCCGNCAKYSSGYGENPCKISASGLCGEWETSIGKF